MNPSHIKAKMRNRLSRLRRKVKVATADRQGRMTSRIRELEALTSK